MDATQARPAGDPDYTPIEITPDPPVVIQDDPFDLDVELLNPAAADGDLPVAAIVFPPDGSAPIVESAASGATAGKYLTGFNGKVKFKKGDKKSKHGKAMRAKKAAAGYHIVFVAYSRVSGKAAVALVNPKP